MAFLTLDGVTIPILSSSVRRKTSTAGGVGRSFRGATQDSRRGSRRVWTMTACFTDEQYGYDDATAFERHVSGEGHFASFEHGLACSTGLNPLSYRIANWSSTAGPDGVPGILWMETPTSFIQYDPQFTDGDWTVVFCEDVADYAAAVYRSDGTGYLNGSAVVGGWSDGNYFTNLSVRVRDGILTMSLGVDDGYLTYLLLLPYKCSDAQAAVWSTIPPSSPYLGPTPALRMAGTCIAEQYTFALGEVQGVEYVQKPQRLDGNVSSVWVNNAKVVTFSLYEIPQSFVRGDKL